MKQRLLLLSLFLSVAGSATIQAQSLLISRYIQVTDTITDEEEMRTFPASSDDAEQENDEIDALFDDDIDAGWEGDPEDFNILTAGMRFRDLFIPKGATIDSAFIVVHSHEIKTATDVANLTIVADANPNAPTFTEDSLIDARTFTNTQIAWIVDVEWGLWTPHRTPDLSALVQEMVDNDGWESGNPIAFIILGEDQGASEVENAREWESFENINDPEDGGDGQNKPEFVPQLLVYYSVDAAQLEQRIVVTDTITDEEEMRTFPASSDDAEQENDEIDALFDDDIDAGWEGDPEDFNILTAGMRFTNLGIPAGATIDSAYITVWSHEIKTSADVANLTIVADANVHAPTFTEDSLIDARTFTNQQISWVVDEEWGLWTPHRTPDLSPLVQKLVDSDGWEAGNPIAFIVLGEDQGASEVENAREWESFENINDPEDGGDGQNKPEFVPRLTVHFSSGMTTGTRSTFASEISPLTVYPNPAKDLLNVELETDARSFIRIFNTNGQIVHQQRADAGFMQQINISNFQQGMYIIQARQNGKVYLQKFIVE